ncbi:unnamed protein product [Orchesella dallaii]|uniref:Uncharacterized protein n=1 Tax=Orchesella dallaii TaxID=48710 RepID=A0ABP1QL98_9HEXA
MLPLSSSSFQVHLSFLKHLPLSSLFISTMANYPIDYGFNTPHDNTVNSTLLLLAEEAAHHGKRVTFIPSGTITSNYTIGEEGFQPSVPLITHFDFQRDQCYAGLFWFNGVHYGNRDYCSAIIIDYSFENVVYIFDINPSMEMLGVFNEFVKMYCRSHAELRVLSYPTMRNPIKHGSPILAIAALENYFERARAHYGDTPELFPTIDKLLFVGHLHFPYHWAKVSSTTDLHNAHRALQDGQFAPNEEPGYPDYMHFQAYTTDDGFLHYFPQADRELVRAGGTAYLQQYRGDFRQLVPAALRRDIRDAFAFTIHPAAVGERLYHSLNSSTVLIRPGHEATYLREFLQHQKRIEENLVLAAEELEAEVQNEALRELFADREPEPDVVEIDDDDEDMSEADDEETEDESEVEEEEDVSDAAMFIDMEAEETDGDGEEEETEDEDWIVDEDGSEEEEDSE